MDPVTFCGRWKRETRLKRSPEPASSESEAHWPRTGSSGRMGSLFTGEKGGWWEAGNEEGSKRTWVTQGRSK